MKIEEVYLGELVKGISEHHVLGVQKLRSNKEKVILFRLDDDGNGGGPALAHGD